MIKVVTALLTFTALLGGGGSYSVAQEISTLCSFNAGPRVGTSQDYAPLDPLPVGTPCQDGVGSSGVIVPKSHLTGASPPRISTICEFTNGPMIGEKHDFAPLLGIPIGSPCQDGAGSSGIIVGKPQLTMAALPLDDDSVAGDWTGALGGRLPLILHLGEDQTGTADSPSQNAFGMPLTYQRDGTRLVVSIPAVRATYTAATLGTELSGAFSQNGDATPLILTRPASVNAVVGYGGPLGANVAGHWYGTLAGKLPLVFHFGSDGNGVVDSPAQNTFGMPLSYTSTRDTLTIVIPSIGATFTATPDGNMLVGVFVQNGQGISFTLTKD